MGNVVARDYAGLGGFGIADTQTEAPKGGEGAADLGRREPLVDRREGGEEELALARFRQRRVESDFDYFVHS